MLTSNIIVEGNYNKIKSSLKEYIIDDKAINEFLLFIENNTDILDIQTESFKKVDFMPTYSKSFIISETNYYVNLKISTVFLIATLLDITLTKSFAALALAFYGVNNRAFVEINEQDGEKCIIIETIKKTDKKGDKYILSHYNNECINNDFKCKYRYNNRCNITHHNIMEIYENLTSKNVFTKTGNIFKYNL